MGEALWSSCLRNSKFLVPCSKFPPSFVAQGIQKACKRHVKGMKPVLKSIEVEYNKKCVPYQNSSFYIQNSLFHVRYFYHPSWDIPTLPPALHPSNTYPSRILIDTWRICDGYVTDTLRVWSKIKLAQEPGRCKKGVNDWEKVLPMRLSAEKRAVFAVVFEPRPSKWLDLRIEHWKLSIEHLYLPE